MGEHLRMAILIVFFVLEILRSRVLIEHVHDLEHLVCLEIIHFFQLLDMLRYV